MLWFLLLVIVCAVFVFSLLAIAAYLAEDFLPAKTLFVSIPSFVVAVVLLKAVLFKESNVSTFYTPTSYSIDEQKGVAYFYLNEHAIPTKEYRLIKNAKDVKIEAVLLKYGIAPFQVSGGIIYNASLTNSNIHAAPIEEKE